MSGTKSTQQAGHLLGPTDNGSGDYSARYFTADTTSKANVVPDSWKGKMVRITFHAVATALLKWGWSNATSPAIDDAVAATDAGAGGNGINLGGAIYGTQTVHVRVPTVIPGADGTVITGSVKFVRKSSVATQAVTMELASD